MALRSLVQRQVQNALRQIRDLGTTITLTDNPTPTYDASTSTVTRTGEATVQTITGLITGSRRVAGDSPGYTTTLIVDAQSTGQLIDQYDTMEFGGYVWRITSVEGNEYILTITVSRGDT